MANKYALMHTRASTPTDLNFSSEIKNLAHDHPIIQTATTNSLPKNNNKNDNDNNTNNNDGDHDNNNSNDNSNSNNNKHIAVIAATVMVAAMTSCFIHETIDRKYYLTTTFYCS